MFSNPGMKKEGALLPLLSLFLFLTPAQAASPRLFEVALAINDAGKAFDAAMTLAEGKTGQLAFRDGEGTRLYQVQLTITELAVSPKGEPYAMLDILAGAQSSLKGEPVQLGAFLNRKATLTIGGYTPESTRFSLEVLVRPVDAVPAANRPGAESGRR